MNSFKRGVFTLIALLSLTSMTLFAQDEASNRAVGSGIVLPLLENLIAENDVEADLNVEITGTTAGIEAFCNGEASLVGVPRPLSVDEEAACTSNDVAYREFLLALNILTFVGNPADNDIAACLSTGDLDTIFAPSAAGQLNNWADTRLYTPPAPPEPDPETTPEPEATPEAEATAEPEPSLPLTLWTTQANTLTYVSLDNRIAGVGLRNDIQFAEPAAIVDAVSNTSGALGVVNFETANGSGLRLFNVNFAESELGCITPSVNNAENGTYSAADRLFLYVNGDAVEALDAVLQLLTQPANAGIIAANGFTPPSASALSINQLVLSGESEGREFSQDVTGFTIPDTLIGEIAIGGAPSAYQFIQNAATNFAESQPNLTVTSLIEGERAGIRRLCNGELDITVVYDTELTDEQAAACEANDVTFYDVPIGSQAVVLVANAANQSDLATAAPEATPEPEATAEPDATAPARETPLCLTTDQIRQIWAAGSDVNNWDQVYDNAGLEMILFGIEAGSIASDLLLQNAPPSEIAETTPEPDADDTEAPIPPVRLDTEINADPLFRAAAVANVEGGLTYMNWQNYVQARGRGQEGIQLVHVDEGNGCIEPTQASINDGTYALSRGTALLIPRTAMTNLSVQSYLWQTFSDQNWVQLNNSGFTGVEFQDFAEIRNDLESEFALAARQRDEANAAAREAAPEVTPEPEATPEATAESE